MEPTTVTTTKKSKIIIIAVLVLLVLIVAFALLKNKKTLLLDIAGQESTEINTNGVVSNNGGETTSPDQLAKDITSATTFDNEKDLGELDKSFK